MIKKSWLLLTVVELMNTVNFNTLYCMEVQDKVEDKSELQIGDQQTLQKKLGMDTTFKEIYDQYTDRETTLETKQDLIVKFCKYLFGEKCENVEKVLSKMRDKNELDCIHNMLKKIEVVEYVLKEKNLLEYISNVNNIHIKHTDDKCYNVINAILSRVKGIVLCKQLDMDTTFEEIYNMYSYNKCNNTDNDFNHISKTNNNPFIQYFFNCLLGNCGRNLETVLSCGVNSELASVYHMLEIYDAKQYLILTNFFKQRHVLNNIFDIVMNIHCDNYSNNIVKDIVDNIRYLMLIYAFDVDRTFHKIYNEYSELTIYHKFKSVFKKMAQDSFCMFFPFGHIYYKYSTATNPPKINDLKNMLVYSLGVHPTFRQIHHKYSKAIMKKYKTAQIKKLYNILFLNNCNVLRTILSHYVNNHKMNSFIEEELGYVIDMLKQDDVIEYFALSLVKQYRNSLVLNSCLCHDILDIFDNVNGKHRKNNVYVELINSIKNIISIALHTIIPINNSLYPDVNFEQIYNEYEKAQYQRKGELIQIKNFCRHLLFENDGNNLRLILSGEIMHELDSIASMLGDTKVKKYIIELLVHNSQLREDILDIVANTKLWYSYCLESPLDCQAKSIRKNLMYCIKHAELGMDFTFKEIYDMYNDDIMKEYNVEKFFKYLFGGNMCDNLRYILYNNSFEDEWYYISDMLDKKEIKQSLISFLSENYELHDRILKIVNRNDVCTSENYENYVVNIQNKIRECVNESKKYEKYYNPNKKK